MKCLVSGAKKLMLMLKQPCHFSFLVFKSLSFFIMINVSLDLYPSALRHKSSAVPCELQSKFSASKNAIDMELVMRRKCQNVLGLQIMHYSKSVLSSYHSIVQGTA